MGKILDAGDIELTGEQGHAMQRYAAMLLVIVGVFRTSGFVAHCDQQRRDGTRVPFNNAEVINLSPEEIAKRSDKCGYPMFPEEIEKWLTHTRFLFCHPTELLKGVEVFDVPLIDLFCHEEFVVFCLWMETQQEDSGCTMYAGPLSNPN